ncbi:MAG: flippase [Thermoplasmata archaeon]
MKTEQRIVKNTSWLMIAKFASRVLSAVLVILLANHLLPVNFGIFNLAFAIAYITAVIIDFGFDEMTVREVSRAKQSTAEILSTVLLSRGLLLFLNFSLLVAVYLLLISYVNTEMTLGVLLIAGTMLAMEKMTASFSAVFQAHERMDLQGITELIWKGVYLTIGFTAISIGLGLESILLLLLISYALYFVVSLSAYSLVIGEGFQKPRVKNIPKSIKTTFPFTVFVLLAVFYGHIVILLLTLLEGDYATGVYSASWKIVVFLGVVPYAFGRGLYPVFSKMYEEGGNMLERAYDRSMKYMLIAGLPITIALYIIADDVLGLIYREEFTATTPVFRTIVWMLPFLFMNGSLKIVLWASNRTFKASFNLFISSVTLIAAGMLLIPVYGVTGAAGAVVIAEMVHFILNYHVVSSFLEPLPVSHLWKPFSASAVMGVVLLLPKIFSTRVFLFYLLISSLLAYAAVLYTVGGVTKKDIYTLTDIFFKR